MTIEATGKINGRPVVIRVTNGSIYGDTIAVAALQGALNAEQSCLIPGIGGGPASLDTDIDIAALLTTVLDDCRFLQGITPDPLPKGAIP